MGGSVEMDATGRALFSVEPVVLEDGVVRLVPMEKGHAEGLMRATHEATFDYFPMKPESWTVEGFEEYIGKRTQLGFVSFVIEVGGEIVGATSYFDIRVEHRGLEIGHTYLSPSIRGSSVNPRMKKLLIGHALEELGAERVQLKTDGRNLASRKAMEGMGFPFEGVLRGHMVMPDGFVRDTVMFGIRPEDWPGVKGRLEELIRERG